MPYDGMRKFPGYLLARRSVSMAEFDPGLISQLASQAQAAELDYQQALADHVAAAKAAEDARIFQTPRGVDPQRDLLGDNLVQAMTRRFEAERAASEARKALHDAVPPEVLLALL
jgi:hypothetical protein